MATDNYSQFDEIRPFNPSELPAVYDRLLASEQFRKVLTYLYPGVDMQTIAGMMHRCRTNLEFQKALCYPFLEQLLAKASHGCRHGKGCRGACVGDRAHQPRRIPRKRNRKIIDKNYGYARNKNYNI